MDESDGGENCGGGGIVFDFRVPMEGYLRIVLRSVNQEKRAATFEIVEGKRGLQATGCAGRSVREAERAASGAHERSRAGWLVTRSAGRSGRFRLRVRGRWEGGAQFGQPPSGATAAPRAL